MFTCDDFSCKAVVGHFFSVSYTSCKTDEMMLCVCVCVCHSIDIAWNDCTCCRGLVPLHNACSYGHYEVTELLIKVCTLFHNDCTSV